MMREIKSVIAFDLFGTLARSAYTGPKYYELLEAHGWGFSPDYVGAVIRGQAMNFSTINWDMRSRRASGIQLDEYAIAREYSALLAKRLGNSFDMPPDAYDGMMISASALNTQNFVSPAELVRCWKAENDALQWIDGAQQTIASLKNAKTAVVLVTNITVVGMYAVHEKLPEISAMFDRCYWSCEFPAAKPDPYMWQSIQREYGDAMYWMVGDDPLIDLVMPRALGWHTILMGDNGVSLAEVSAIIGGAPCI